MKVKLVKNLMALKNYLSKLKKTKLSSLAFNLHSITDATLRSSKTKRNKDLLGSSKKMNKIRLTPLFTENFNLQM